LHPDLNIKTDDPTLTELNSPNGATATSPAVYPKIVHSSYFNLQASDTDGQLQARYFSTNVNNANNKYPLKMGFYTNDRYLIGKNTCGSYLYLSPPNYSSILVNGADYRSTKDIEFGSANQIVIPVVYQFRMTDFFGDGVNGTGRIGGFSVQPSNLVYTKKIGIDIAVKDEPLFSFDIQVT
jgi:hypothetical protein